MLMITKNYSELQCMTAFQSHCLLCPLWLPCDVPRQFWEAQRECVDLPVLTLLINMEKLQGVLNSSENCMKERQGLTCIVYHCSPGTLEWVSAAFSVRSPGVPVPRSAWAGPFFHHELLEHIGPGLCGDAGQGALAALGLQSAKVQQPVPLKARASFFSALSFTISGKLNLNARHWENFLTWDFSMLELLSVVKFYSFWKHARIRETRGHQHVLCPTCGNCALVP